MRLLSLTAAVVLAGGLAFAFWPKDSTTAQNTPTESTALVDVYLPESLSANAAIGQRVFEAKCAACHGFNAAGNAEAGPPLVHKIYEPSHHGDASFQRATQAGVRAHHWKFGNMPPVEGITPAEVSAIVAYVRELQRANDIF